MGGWKSFLRQLLGSLGGLLLLALIMIFVANPYGNLSLSPMRHVLMDDNQRFQYPAVIRSGRYDSLVIGTSTSRLLEPAALEKILGGRFANLALNSGTPWEQWQIAQLFAREVSSPRTLLVGLDHVWCEADADTRRITRRGFPEWMFDDSPWNDFLHMLNIRTLEIAGRRFGYALGLVKERWPHNGYEVFVPPDESYDLQRARQHIYGMSSPPSVSQRGSEPAFLDVVDDGKHVFPALAWLDDILQSKAYQRVVLVTMPTHVASIARPETNNGARDAICRARLVRAAAQYGLPVIDFRFPSPITREDSHYWDALHFRVPIAKRVVEGLGRALREGRDDPGGDFRVLRGLLRP